MATVLTSGAATRIRLVVAGQEVVTDVAPVIIGGRGMVPARFVAEPLGLRLRGTNGRELFTRTRRQKYPSPLSPLSFEDQFFWQAGFKSPFGLLISRLPNG